MARKNRFGLSTRLVIGAIIFIIIGFVIVNFNSLTITNPFASSINFRDLDSVFQQFSVAEANSLLNYVKGTQQEILSKNCNLKLYAEVLLKDGRIIPLNSAFQPFGQLTSFSLATPQGTDIVEFRNIELRMACDVVEDKNGKRLPFEVIPRPNSPLSLYVYALNEVGQNKLIKGGSFNPEVKYALQIFTSSVPIITTTNAINVNPESKIIFDDSRLPDPLQGAGNLLFIGNERVISKPVSFKASDMESAIDATNPLATKSTYETEMTITVSGSFDLNFPDLQTKVTGFPHQIPVDQGLLQNKFDFLVKKSVPKTITPSLTLKTVDITSVDPLKVITDGSNDLFVFVKASVKLNDYNAIQEGKPTGEIRLQKFQNGVPILVQDAFPTATSLCSPKGTSGLDTLFECTFAIRQNVEVGTYRVTIKSTELFRTEDSASFDVIRSGSPVGTGCPEGQIRNSIGLCEFFGSTGGIFGGTCPTGQTKNDKGECIVPSGTTGGELPSDCPIAGYVKDSLGKCVPTSGVGGEGAKACFDCNSNQIRVVLIADECPVFHCSDGTTTGQGTPLCKDGKVADKTEKGYTCSRVGGTSGGLGLPKIIPCEAGETADTKSGEICVNPLIYGLFQNYNFVWLGLGFIVLIIIIAIIGSALKGRP